MASESTGPIGHSAQVIGNVFVDQYYHILHTTPEFVHRFYQDSSVVSRPGANETMTTVTTMQGINEKIVSLNFKDCKAEITTADAQDSYKNGVTVLVTGFLTGQDNVRRKFVQSFFLAPQKNGFFVLNDVFRYVDENKSSENHVITGNEPNVVRVTPHQACAAEEKNGVKKTNVLLCSPKELSSEKGSHVESPSDSSGNDFSVIVESDLSLGQEDAEKISYASIVRVPKGNLGPTKSHTYTAAPQVTSKELENRSGPSTAACEPEVPMPVNDDIPIAGNDQQDGYSIYIRNLPFNLTVPQLEVIFKKFGPIVQEGIQIRHNKQQGYRFGFVEFHHMSSMNTAVKASPMLIGGSKVFIEIKRTTTQVGGRSSRFRSGGGGGGGAYPNNTFIHYGYDDGGRGFGRNDFRNRGEFSGWIRGPYGRSEGYQQRRARVVLSK